MSYYVHIQLYRSTKRRTISFPPIAHHQMNDVTATWRAQKQSTANINLQSIQQRVAPSLQHIHNVGQCHYVGAYVTMSQCHYRSPLLAPTLLLRQLETSGQQTMDKSPQEITSMSYHITSISPHQHITSPAYHLTSISHHQHITSPIYHITSVLYHQHITSPACHITNVSAPVACHNIRGRLRLRPKGTLSPRSTEPSLGTNLFQPSPETETSQTEGPHTRRGS